MLENHDIEIAVVVFVSVNTGLGTFTSETMTCGKNPSHIEWFRTHLVHRIVQVGLESQQRIKRRLQVISYMILVGEITQLALIMNDIVVFNLLSTPTSTREQRHDPNQEQ